MNQFIKSFRAYLGGIALGMGFVGILVTSFFALISIPLAEFGVGLGERESPRQVAMAHHQAAVDHELHGMLCDRVLPMLMLSFGLIAYGYFEAHVEKKVKNAASL
jgi:hypothetical protein